ncbi:MAG: topoisomerase DNA-binding C4 zinc finger domain-containing protein, partial [Clostridia bacterium]|nr:topoisomerase DNA-binding C4 zinc finger domain-containing protein [Clostridia bacterium]
ELKKNICPRCGGALTERDGKYGVFYGCSNFPKCKFTMKKEK